MTIAFYTRSASIDSAHGAESLGAAELPRIRGGGCGAIEALLVNDNFVIPSSSCRRHERTRNSSPSRMRLLLCCRRRIVCVNNTAPRRYIELDLLRTLAIAMMVVYHAAYDLETYYGWKIGVFEEEGWYVLRQETASLFLLLVGCSFAISWDRQCRRHGGASFAFRYRKYFLRGLGVITCGMLISAVTFWWEPATYVRFGILHLIGVSIMLLPLFARGREGNLLVGLMITGLGLGQGIVQTSLLLPLGWMPSHFSSVDYFPLIPWFGIVLMGYSIGYFTYVRHKSQLSLRLPLWMTWPGQHALVIYLVHQPIILGLLGLVGHLGFL